MVNKPLKAVDPESKRKLALMYSIIREEVEEAKSFNKTVRGKILERFCKEAGCQHFQATQYFMKCKDFTSMAVDMGLVVGASLSALEEIKKLSLDLANNSEMDRDKINALKTSIEAIKGQTELVAKLEHNTISRDKNEVLREKIRAEQNTSATQMALNYSDLPTDQLKDKLVRALTQRSEIVNLLPQKVEEKVEETDSVPEIDETMIASIHDE